MHIGNGAVTITCAAYGLAAAASGWALATALLRRSRTPAPLHFALATAAVFALQALNVPVLAGVSGHLVGAFLLAYWFGALWGLAGISIVLGAQGVLFGDGGWMGFGLNVLNMGILPCLVVYPAWKWAAGETRGWRRGLSIGAAAWTSTVLGAIACGIQLGGDTEAGWLAFMSTLLSVHLLIGLVEAGLTVALVAAVSTARQARHVPWAAPAAVVVLVLIASFGASPWPDGLEYSLHAHGLGAAASDLSARINRLQAAVTPFADYTLISTLIAGAGIAMTASLVAGLSQWKARV